MARLAHVRWILHKDARATRRAIHVEHYINSREYSRLAPATSMLDEEMPPLLKKRWGWLYA